MTPHRYAVVKIGRMSETVIRMSHYRGNGIAYHQHGDETTWHGDLTDDCQVYWCDDVGTQDQLLHTLSQLFPDNSYAKVTTTDVVYVPRGEPQRARFTEAGLVPA